MSHIPRCTHASYLEKLTRRAWDSREDVKRRQKIGSRLGHNECPHNCYLRFLHESNDILVIQKDNFSLSSLRFLYRTHSLAISQRCTYICIFRLSNGRFIRRIRSSSDAGGSRPPPAGNISIHSSARDIVHGSVQIVDTPISIYRPYV